MSAFSVAGIVFANSYDDLLGRITKKRSMASVPFGSRYRLVDFALSNFVNADVSNIGIVTKENYRSLMNHLGSGASWDLDRKNGGIRVFPPYSLKGERRYEGSIGALHSALDFIKHCNSQYLVVMNSDIVANVDLSAAIEAHTKTCADITVVYTNGKYPVKHDDIMVPQFDENGRIIKAKYFDDGSENVNFALGISIFNRELLLSLVQEAFSAEKTSIYSEMLDDKLSSLKVYGFEHKGFAKLIDSERDYYDVNMSLLDSNVRNELFNKKRPVYTKTRDDMPTRYGTKAKVSNSFIGDGCVIDGTVKNSILFRGVKVEKGAVVENSIIMQSGHISKGAVLDCVVADKYSFIGPQMVVKGTKERLFLLEKNQTF